MKIVLLVLCSLVAFVYGDDGGILQIHYPNISIEADADGNITLQSGKDASVYLIPGPGGSVYFDGENLLQLIQVINSLPPVWKDHSSVGFFHTAFGGDVVNVKLEAIDPDNDSIDYRVVAGTMPPGLHIDNKNNLITGQVPDVDAIYSFTVRATNNNDKYADAVFRMEIIERNQCVLSAPCENGGTCVDMVGDRPYLCQCTDQYSGNNCNIVCETNSLGVNDTAIVPEAMMSAFLTRENFTASEGRLDGTGGGGKGWCGVNSNSWLQIDLGTPARIFGAVEQSYSSEYYTGSYYMSYSIDGTNFDYVMNPDNTTSTTYTTDAYSTTINPYGQYEFPGSSSTTASTASLPDPITARFVRFHPVSYSSSQYPCMRVDLLGCYETIM